MIMGYGTHQSMRASKHESSLTIFVVLGGVVFRCRLDRHADTQIDDSL
jgi:hypothetical protein